MNEFINIAIKEAFKSNYSYTNGSKFRLGAVILDKNQVVARGHNQRQSGRKDASDSC